MGNVHTLILSSCNCHKKTQKSQVIFAFLMICITDVSALGNVYTLDLSYCRNIEIKLQ